MDSEDSLDIVHRHPGQGPGSPGRLNNVQGQCPLTMDNVHCPWTDLVKRIEVKVASLEIYIHISF